MMPSSPRLLRTAGALWIFLTLIWLPFEDTAIWTAVVLAAAGSLWLWWRYLSKPDSNRWLGLTSGVLLGAGTPLFATFLMAVKSGLHGHGFADFTARQVLTVLNLIPLTFLVGTFLGLLTVFYKRN
jgi:hypothetical protein